MIRYDLFKHLSVGMTSQVIFDLARMFDNPEDLEKYLLEEVEIPKGVLTKKATANRCRSRKRRYLTTVFFF